LQVSCSAQWHALGQRPAMSELHPPLADTNPSPAALREHFSCSPQCPPEQLRFLLQHGAHGWLVCLSLNTSRQQQTNPSLISPSSSRPRLRAITSALSKIIHIRPGHFFQKSTPCSTRRCTSKTRRT